MGMRMGMGMRCWNNFAFCESLDKLVAVSHPLPLQEVSDEFPRTQPLRNCECVLRGICKQVGAVWSDFQLNLRVHEWLKVMGDEMFVVNVVSEHDYTDRRDTGKEGGGVKPPSNLWYVQPKLYVFGRNMCDNCCRIHIFSYHDISMHPRCFNIGVLYHCMVACTFWS